MSNLKHYFSEKIRKLDEERQNMIPKIETLENDVLFLKKQSLPMVDKFNTQIESLGGKITSLGIRATNVSSCKRRKSSERDKHAKSKLKEKAKFNNTKQCFLRTIKRPKVVIKHKLK